MDPACASRAGSGGGVAASRARRGAFTLVELLVAMSVSLLLIVVLLRVFSAATTSWQKGEAQADAFREARGALQLMARDLSTTIHPVTTNVDGTTTAANPLLPTLVLGRYPSPEPPSDGGTTTLNEEVYCLTNIINSATPVQASTPGGPVPTQTMASETCAVGYFCQWMPAIAATNAANRAPSAFALMRQFLNSDGVSARLQASNGSKNPLGFTDLFSRVSLLPGVAAQTNPPGATSTQLAAYIWDLKFRIDTTLAATGNGEAAAMSDTTRVPYDHTLTLPPRIYDGRTTPYPSVLPSYVEIRFKALSTGAGRRLEGNQNVHSSDWVTTDPSNPAVQNPTPVYRQLIQPNARQFVLRVPLINANPIPNP